MAIIKGNNQKNILNGGVGDDILIGYGGDDILNAGAGNDNLKGGQGADILIGGTGNDRLDGGSGADVLIGGDGNDIYIVDHPDDVISETAEAGIDTVKSSISWLLGENIENLTLTGMAEFGTGNGLNNKLIGNNANNGLYGGDGNDMLSGGSGTDTLAGGAGNDTLRISDFNGDNIDGGAGIDKLQIMADNQTLDLRNMPPLKNIETIQLGDSHSTLILNLQSILDLSPANYTLKIDASDGSNTLKMDNGWDDHGLIKGYHTFTQFGFTLRVNPVLTDIQVNAYTISDTASAAGVGNVFDSGEQEIIIDFGGGSYNQWGLDSIDLSGFGLEDKLMVAQRDGALNYGTAQYHTSQKSIYIYEFTSNPGYSFRDRVSWQVGATHAKLISEKRANTGGQVSFPSPLGLGAVEITGLPSGLPASQFVFV